LLLPISGCQLLFSSQNSWVAVARAAEQIGRRPLCRRICACEFGEEKRLIETEKMILERKCLLAKST
jgi:hypothetical protein